MPEVSSTGLWRDEHLRLAIEAAEVALWSWNLDDDTLMMDERAFRLWGIPIRTTVSFEDLSAQIHPADRDRVRMAFAATRDLPGAYEIDFRILIGGDVRWVSARGQGGGKSAERQSQFGIFLDVTGRKQAEESNELLAGEMSHRVKNLLAIASGLTAISARSGYTATEMATELTNRLTALGRAHDLVRPLSSEEGKAALLGDLVAIVLAPYESTGAYSGRIRVAVPRMGVGEQTTTTLALVLHELATNSVKYGALSVECGILDVSGGFENSDVVITWTEHGGPERTGAADLSGFGSKLIMRGIERQLYGTIKYEWETDGLRVILRMNKDRLSN